MSASIRRGQNAAMAAVAGRRAYLPGVLAAAALILAFPLTGAGAESVATMGGIKLGADKLKQIVEDRPQLRSQVAASAEALDRIVRDALIRYALLEEAQSKGWDKRPEIARRADEAREQVILDSYLSSIAQPPANYPSEEEISAFYENNRARLTMPQRYHLAQIFVKRPQAQGAAAEAAAGRAADLARRAKAKGADFAALAKAESEEDLSKVRGGDIGWNAESNIVPEVRAVLPGLKVGDASDAIASARGWHVVKLIESKPPSGATLEEARPVVINALRSQKAGELGRAYIDALLKRSPISLDREALSKVRGELK